MKKKLFLKQLEYDVWANNKIIEVIFNADEMLEGNRPYEILSHLICTPKIWLMRALDKTTNLKSWGNLKLIDCFELSNENHEDWKKFILSKTDKELEQHFNFSFKGNESKISIEDLLIHLVNHSSYHRGQIILLLKGKIEPLPLTTYIAFAAIKV
tara:strand:+ start:43542 stop:44006 length:465 start_codon:yes stop_codon:yes gene_type:complete